MTVYDSVWQCMTVYDSVWQLMTANDSYPGWAAHKNFAVRVICVPIFDKSCLILQKIESHFLNGYNFSILSLLTPRCLLNIVAASSNRYLNLEMFTILLCYWLMWGDKNSVVIDFSTYICYPRISLVCLLIHFHVQIYLQIFRKIQ